MIGKKTNTNFSDTEVEKLRAEAGRRDMMNPTTRSILSAIIADLPEVPCCDSPSEDKCEQCQETGKADPKNQG